MLSVWCMPCLGVIESNELDECVYMYIYTDLSLLSWLSYCVTHTHAHLPIPIPFVTPHSSPCYLVIILNFVQLATVHTPCFVDYWQD